MGGFLSAIFGGQNPTLNKTIDQLGQMSGYSQGIGQGDTTLASNYFRNLLSGDQGMEAKALAPEISAQQQQAQQARNNLAQFGNRSGGTGAAAQAINAQGRGNLINLLGGLQNSAAGNLANIGQSNLGLATEQNSQEAQQSQQRLQNYMNSILGKGIGSAVGAAESFGLGTGLGSAAGGGPATPAMLPGVSGVGNALPGAVSGGAYTGAMPGSIAYNPVPLSQIFG